MPGGRLTYQDRQHIARQLARGLGFAEIARELRRPTSTVSREVNRNGGQSGYLAEEAHQLSTRRTRRASANSRARHEPDLDDAQRDRHRLRDFQHRFTTMLIDTGFPPMTARVLGSLYTCDSASLTAAELTHQLGVSAASVSKAVQNLETLGMVRRERDPYARRERYCLERGVWYRAWTVRARAMETWAFTARQGSELVGRDTPAGIRLTEMSDFLGCVRQELTRTSEEWHERCIRSDLERETRS